MEKNFYWTEEEIRYLLNSIGIKTYKEIASVLKKSEIAVRKKAFRIKNNGTEKKTRIDEWTKEEISFLIENFEKRSFAEIGDVLSRTSNAVRVKSHKLGLCHPIKNIFNVNFFSGINSRESAYWLGFIFADGYILYSAKKRQYTLGIEIKTSDKEHLKKFNKSISGNLEIFDIQKSLKNNPRKYFISKLRVYSKSMVEDLILLGVMQNKSLTIRFPELNEKFIWDFIRGYFDGDGSISIEKRSNQLRCNFASGSIEFLKDIKHILDSFNIKSYITRSSPKSNCYQLGITGKNSTKKFLNYIYNDADVFLERKYKYYIANMNLLDYINNGWDQ